MKLTTKQSIEAFRKLPQAQHDIILRGAELLAAKTGLPLPECIHVIAECCVAALPTTAYEATGQNANR